MQAVCHSFNTQCAVFCHFYSTLVIVVKGQRGRRRSLSTMSCDLWNAVIHPQYSYTYVVHAQYSLMCVVLTP